MSAKPVPSKARNLNASDSKKPITNPSHEAIAKLAYEMWSSEGQQSGCDQKNWFAAEAQLKRG